MCQVQPGSVPESLSRTMELRKRTIFGAIFCGDIHLHRPEKKALYMVGTSILGS